MPIRFRMPGLAEALGGLAAATGRVQDPRPVLEALGRRMMHHSIPENFRQGGRPNRWRGVARDGQIMRSSGRLLRSIRYRVDRSGLQVGTNLAYAPQRQFGGIVKAKGKALAIPVNPNVRSRRRPRHYKNLVWHPGRGGPRGHFRGLLVQIQGKRRRRVIPRFILMRQVKQEARPFLVWQREDIAFAQRAMLQHALGREV